MSRVLGIRVEPTCINWAVVEGQKDLPILVGADNAVAPATYDEGQSLSWYRDRMMLIMQQFEPAAVAVRYPEPRGRAAGSDAMRKRVRIEGVVLESANTSGCRIMTGALVTISAHLKTK